MIWVNRTLATIWRRVCLVHVKIGSLVKIETMWRKSWKFMCVEKFWCNEKVESLKKKFGTKQGSLASWLGCFLSTIYEQWMKSGTMDLLPFFLRGKLCQCAIFYGIIQPALPQSQTTLFIEFSDDYKLFFIGTCKSFLFCNSCFEIFVAYVISSNDRNCLIDVGFLKNWHI